MMRCLPLAAMLLTMPLHADVITDWNNAAISAIRIGKTAPPAAARNLAILHAAMFDAVNGIGRTHEPYRVRRAGPRWASKEAAANAAGHRILTVLFPPRSADFDVLRARIEMEIADRKGVAAGSAWGESVATDFLIWRSGDGAGRDVEIAKREDPGDWQRTPPAYGPYLLPQWGTVQPFVLDDVPKHRPPAPPPLSSAQWVAEYNEVKAKGRDTSSTRTAEQEEIALFWNDGPGTETPPGHWNRIARDVAAAKGNTLEENAHLFALLNVVMADAAICAWDAKHAYSFWRPVTAIRNGDADGNPGTDPDPEWRSLITTPPFPEYVSGHSAFSGAAAHVLAMFYRGDDMVFTTQSDYLPGITRAYSTFSEAAEEAAASRLYGGIHFRSAIETGLRMGRALGEMGCSTKMRRL